MKPIHHVLLAVLLAWSLAHAQGRDIAVNGIALDDRSIAALETAYRTRLQPGRYWYDRMSGLWGLELGPSQGQIAPGLALGGPLNPRASVGRQAGITRVFVPGGDVDPVGDYPDAFSLLEDLHTLSQPFEQIGIAGYPETHPKIDDDLTVQAMWDKRRHATHIVSNLTFDAGAVKSWVERMRRRGVTTPLLLGMPGPIDRTKLLSMATKIGVGESTRFLAKNKGTFARLAAPGGWTGQRFLEECAGVAAKPEALIEGLHVFTFNQIAETEAWRQEMLERL